MQPKKIHKDQRQQEKCCESWKKCQQARKEKCTAGLKAKATALSSSSISIPSLNTTSMSPLDAKAIKILEELRIRANKGQILLKENQMLAHLVSRATGTGQMVVAEHKISEHTGEGILGGFSASEMDYDNNKDKIPEGLMRISFN